MKTQGKVAHNRTLVAVGLLLGVMGDMVARGGGG